MTPLVQVGKNAVFFLILLSRLQTKQNLFLFFSSMVACLCFVECCCCNCILSVESLGYAMASAEKLSCFPWLFDSSHGGCFCWGVFHAGRLPTLRFPFGGNGPGSGLKMEWLESGLRCNLNTVPTWLIIGWQILYMFFVCNGSSWSLASKVLFSWYL